MGFEIINTIKKEKGLTNAQISVMSGVTLSTLDKITSGVNTNPKLDTLQAICRVLGCTLNDFVDDLPAKEKAPHSDLSEEAHQIAKDYEKLPSHGKDAVRVILKFEEKAAADFRRYEDDTGKVIAMPKRKRNNIGLIEFKVYDQPSAAGLGNYLDEPDYHIEQYPEDVIPADADFGIIISGDSMEPKVHDGGTVFVQAMPSIESGKIGIFVLNGKSYCKKLEVDRGKQQVRLVSVNPKYDDIIVGEFDNLRTVGRVLGQWTPGRKQDLFGW